MGIPDHELLRCIGRGAYGAVWLARNVMGTFRAVKIVHRDDFTRDRPFTREYEGLLNYEPISRSHPNLMQILHVGRRDGYFYYVTELADAAAPLPLSPAAAAAGDGLGGSLPGADGMPADLAAYVPRTLREDLERRGRVPVRECLGIAVALASALKHLHDRALVHRDVKPSNVIFVHGVPKLADIGLVATAGDSRSIVGTEGYLPPEGPGNPQADLYGLGKLLYELSTGLSRTEYPRLPPNLRNLADFPEVLEFNEILLRACARDTERRYARADELLADLALLERGDSVKRLRRLERHHALLKRVGAGLLAAALVASAAWWQTWRTQRITHGYLAQLRVNEGTERLLQGEYAAALPPLVSALCLEAGDARRERVHRVRLASVLDRCPVPVACFTVPEARVLAADLSPDGARLATGHEDGRVRLWNLDSGDLVRELAHEAPVLVCRFLSSGDRLLSVTVGQKARLWDLARPESEPSVFDQAVEFSSDLYSVGLNQMLRRAYLSKALHCFARIQPLNPAHDGGFENLSLGLKVVSDGGHARVRYEVRAAAPGSALLYSDDFRDSPQADRFAEGIDNPPGPLLGQVYVMLETGSFGDEPDQDGQVIWDNLRVRTYPARGPPPAWRVVADFSDSRLTNWVHVGGPLTGGACAVEDGRLVCTDQRLPPGQNSGRGAIWREPLELSDGQTLEIAVDLVRARAPHPVVGLSLCRPSVTPHTAPDRPFVLHDRWLALTWWDATLRLWDLAHNRFVAAGREAQAVPMVLRHLRGVRDVDVHPDGRTAAAVSLNHACRVWDLATGTSLTAAALEGFDVTGARYSPDGRLLAVTRLNGIELIGTQDWRVTWRLEPDAGLAQPRFSPRGHRLAAVRDGRTVLVWELGDLERPPRAWPHAFPVRRITFSLDGRILASDAEDDRVRLWDVVQGEPLEPPLAGALAGFSPAGRHAALIGVDGGVWLWDLAGMLQPPLSVHPPGAAEPLEPAVGLALRANVRGRGVSLQTADGASTLPHPAPVRRVWFSSERRYLVAETIDLRSFVWDLTTLTLVAPPWPSRYHAACAGPLWLDLPAEPRDLETLSDLAGLLGGERPDRRGGLTPVDPLARAAVFARLKQARPGGFPGDDPRGPAWHEGEAARAEAQGEWDGAAFHWAKALDSDTRVRRPISEVEGSLAAPGRGSPVTAGRLEYARRAAEVAATAIRQGRSRWSAILPRPPCATGEMLDLGALYNLGLGQPLTDSPPAPSLRTLPGGVHVLGGIGFDVRGVIDLGLARHVTIPVNRPCRRIHFLHAASDQAAWNRESLGTYKVTYAGGEPATVDLINPEHVPPCVASDFHWRSSVARTSRGAGSGELDGVTAWVGSTPELARRDLALFLTRTTWTLPPDRAGATVKDLELRAGGAASTVLVLAITVEPAE